MERRCDQAATGVVNVIRVALLAFVLVFVIALPIVPASRAATTVNVSIVDFAFQPADVYIQPGDTVRWTNTVSTPHSVISDAGSAESFGSSILGLNGVFTHVFNGEGDFGYHCGVHSTTMFGTVHVSAAIPEFSSLPIVILGLLSVAAAISTILGRKR